MDISRVSRYFYYLGCASLTQLIVRPLSSLTLSECFFFIALWFAVTGELASGKKISMRIPAMIVVGVIMYTLSGLLSTINSSSVLGSLGVMVRFIYLTIIWFWLGIAILRNVKQVHTAMLFWLFSASITGAGAVAQLFWSNAIPGTEQVWGRMTGFTGHPNDLGGVSAVAIGSVWPLLISGGRSLGNLLTMYIIFAFLCAGLILSGSVGGLFAAISSLCLWVVFGKKLRSMLMLTILLSVVVSVILGVQTDINGNRVFQDMTSRVLNGGPTDPYGGTLWSRIATYQAALQEVENNPIIGVGPQPGGAKTGTGFAVHNFLLGAWFEAGFLGIIGILTIIISVLGIGYTTFKQSVTREDKSLALALCLSSIAFFVYSMGAPGLYQRYGWIAVALLVALRACQVRQKRILKYAKGKLMQYAKGNAGLSI